MLEYYILCPLRDSNYSEFKHESAIPTFFEIARRHFKDTVSPAERCDFVGVKLEKVHELFQVCRICGKGMVFYNMAQHGLLHHKSLCT